MIARLTMDTSAATWRGRAMRYVLIYVVLALVLVGVRYATQDVRANLLKVGAREKVLITQRDNLEVQLQMLTTPQRIREWAFAQGMRRFAEAPKVTAAIPALPLPANLPLSPPDPSNSVSSNSDSSNSGPSLAPAAQSRLEVTTQWK